MINLSRILLAMAVFLIAGSAYAEDAPKAPDVQLVRPATTEGPKTLKRLVDGADKLVVSKLEMVLFSNKESGQTAILKVIPLMNPGCKFGLTYNF